MALSSDELNQIRDMIKIEIKQAFSPGKCILRLLVLLSVLFLGVLLLHVLVIAGFTVYHLMHTQ